MTPEPLAAESWPVLATRIADWLPAARWFGAKGAVPAAVTIHDAAPLPGGVDLLLVDVFPDGAATGAGASRWVVPVDRTTGADAAGRDSIASWIAAAALGGGSVDGRHGRFVGHPIAGAGLPPRAGATVTPLGGDASNTSSLLGARDGAGSEAAIVVKLLRRALAGENPEVEVGRFLAESTDWRGTPRLLGHLAWEPFAAGTAAAAAPPTTIATLHAFAAGCSSAWEHGLALAERSAGPAGPALAPLARHLGSVTAGMHAALASRADIPAFAPRPATRSGRRALAGRLVSHARAVLERAASAPAAPATAARLRRLADGGAALEDILARVAEAGTTAAEIRVHGDYHLGQVLVDATGARLLPIDFEGEPSRPLAERREPVSACKDVAGMCRSFDYLLRQAARTAGVAPEASAPLAAAFLAGYRDAAPGATWWPADRAEEAALLDAFTIDKALYELAYEIDNRPDWVEVPLGALETLLAERATG